MNRQHSLRYLPGLDGLRAVAVLAVILYHANKSWVTGGFLGVEVFFVISGYLITMLLINESQENGKIDFRAFWMRRARRLLPALWTLLVGVTTYCALFERDTLGSLRGDVIAAVVYGFNWFQIWVGTSYFSAFGFVPLRHLWSLAVEEQFYLVWPVLIALVLKLFGRRPLLLGTLFFAASIAVSIYVARTFEPGASGSVLETPDHYLALFGHTVSKVDFLFLGTLGRSGGLLIGSALAFWWKPSMFHNDHPTSERHIVSAVGWLGVLGLGAMLFTFHDVVEGGIDGGTSGYAPLFQGGFLLVGLASIAIIAAAVHPHTLLSKRVLGNPVLVYVGQRSYGLYLFHWPIFQFYRQFAGRGLNVLEFVLLFALALAITEVSYRFIEMPVRSGNLREAWGKFRHSRLDSDREKRQSIIAIGVVSAVVPLFALVSLATAQVKLDDIGQSLADGESGVVNVLTSTTLVAASMTTIAGANNTSDITGTSVIAPETTTLDGQVIEIIAIGDSVMLGAANVLTERGITVDALKSRPFRQALEIANYLKSVNRLGEIVIIHLGTNNYVDQKTLDEIMVPLSNVDTVVFVTNHVPTRKWQEPNNKLIRAMPDQYGNVKILDWYTIAVAHPEYLYGDKIHLNPEGQAVYADLIMQVIGK
jgi:peptidoglycan/LPS O-acetylase OafA/YrhL